MNPVLSFAVRSIAYVHLISGICCFADPIVLKVTSLAGLGWIMPMQQIGPYFVGALLILIGAAAFVAPLAPTKAQATILVLPQQVVLLFQLLSIMEAIITSRYPDGYIPSSGFFILADQSPTIFLSWGHVIAYLHAETELWKS